MNYEPWAQIVAWAAPIASTIIVTAVTASINAKIKSGEQKRDEARAETQAEREERAKWRAGIEQRLDTQDGKINAVLDAQCTQMRSDITHKIHRYLDDLQAASTEEKQSLWAEYEVYCDICDKYGIENHFVEQLIKQVMDLPDRPQK